MLFRSRAFIPTGPPRSPRTFSPGSRPSQIEPDFWAFLRPEPPPCAAQIDPNFGRFGGFRRNFSGRRFGSGCFRCTSTKRWPTYNGHVRAEQTWRISRSVSRRILLPCNVALQRRSPPTIRISAGSQADRHKLFSGRDPRLQFAMRRRCCI